MKSLAPLSAVALGFLVGVPAAAAAVSVDNVKVEVKTNTVGRNKGSEYLRVSFLAHVEGSVPTRHTVFVKGSCRVADRRVSDDIHALGAKLEVMSQGETKELTVPLFMSAGLGEAPSQCDLSFRLTKLADKYGSNLGEFCWNGGRLAKSGSCE